MARNPSPPSLAVTPQPIIQLFLVTMEKLIPLMVGEREFAVLRGIKGCLPSPGTSRLYPYHHSSGTQPPSLRVEAMPGGSLKLVQRCVVPTVGVLPHSPVCQMAVDAGPVDPTRVSMRGIS